MVVSLVLERVAGVPGSAALVSNQWLLIVVLVVENEYPSAVNPKQKNI
jgi:hypothetical protein